MHWIRFTLALLATSVALSAHAGIHAFTCHGEMPNGETLNLRLSPSGHSHGYEFQFSQGSNMVLQTSNLACAFLEENPLIAACNNEVFRLHSVLSRYPNSNDDRISFEILVNGPVLKTYRIIFDDEACRIDPSAGPGELQFGLL